MDIDDELIADKLPKAAYLVSGIGAVQSISVRPGCLVSAPSSSDPTLQPMSHSALPSTPSFGRCKAIPRKAATISSTPQSRSYIDSRPGQYLQGMN